MQANLENVNKNEAWCCNCFISIIEWRSQAIYEWTIFNFRRQAHMCVLANNCDEAMYVKLVEALCAEHGINLIKVTLTAEIDNLVWQWIKKK